MGALSCKQTVQIGHLTDRSTRTASIIAHQWYSHLCSFQHRCVHVHRHTRSLTVHPQHIHTIQHSSPVLASLYLMILTLHAQQRGTPFCTESLRGYNKRQKRRLCCALSFFPWQKKKKEREGGKEKKIRPAAIKQLHFRVCWSWRSVFVGGQWRKRRQAPVLQPDNKDSPTLLSILNIFFFFFASLQPEDADQD